MITRFYFPTVRLRLKVLWSATRCLFTGSIVLDFDPSPEETTAKAPEDEVPAGATITIDGKSRRMTAEEYKAFTKEMEEFKAEMGNFGDFMDGWSTRMSRTVEKTVKIFK